MSEYTQLLEQRETLTKIHEMIKKHMDDLLSTIIIRCVNTFDNIISQPYYDMQHDNQLFSVNTTTYNNYELLSIKICDKIDKIDARIRSINMLN